MGSGHYFSRVGFGGQKHLTTHAQTHTQENIKTLVSYVIENFWSTLETVEYIDTFKALRLKHEQEMDRRDGNDSASAT